jgi:hypothetical protein
MPCESGGACLGENWEKKGAKRHGCQSCRVRKQNNLLVSAICMEANVYDLLCLTVCCTFGAEAQLDPAASRGEEGHRGTGPHSGEHFRSELLLLPLP